MNWNGVSSVTMTMPATIYVGMAVTAGDNTKVCEATFTNVSVEKY